MFQAPEESALVVPLEVVPSKSSTVLAASALPETLKEVSCNAAPLAGLSIETVGTVVSTVHSSPAGVGSVLPDASVARTWKVCLPSERPVKAFGDVQLV